MRCNKCGEQKALSEFVASQNYKDGVRPLCKSCKAEQNRLDRLKKKESVLKPMDKLTDSPKRSMGVGGTWKARERDPNEALPNLINRMAGVYVPDTKAFYRNDGHKHLKSLGDRC